MIHCATPANSNHLYDVDEEKKATTEGTHIANDIYGLCERDIHIEGEM